MDNKMEGSLIFQRIIKKSRMRYFKRMDNKKLSDYGDNTKSIHSFLFLTVTF